MDDTIEAIELRTKMREFVKDLMQYRNLNINYDESVNTISIVYFEEPKWAVKGEE